MKKSLFIVALMVCGVYANSPQGLKNLTKEHEKVLPTHEKQLITIINKLELDKFINLNTLNFIYDYTRYNRLIFYNFIINAQKEFSSGTKTNNDK